MLREPFPLLTGVLVASIWAWEADHVAAWMTYIAEADEADLIARLIGFGWAVVLPVALTAVILCLGLFLAVTTAAMLAALVFSDAWLDLIEGLMNFFVVFAALGALEIPFQAYMIPLLIGFNFVLTAPAFWPRILTVTWRDSARGVLPLAPEVAKARITPADLRFDAASTKDTAPLYFFDPIAELAVTSLDAQRAAVTETTLSARQHWWEVTYSFAPHPEGCLVTLDLVLHRTAPGCYFRLWNQNAALKAIHALQAAYGSGADLPQAAGAPALT